jgi:transglutaminase-like putative cysteine protease
MASNLKAASGGITDGAAAFRRITSPSGEKGEKGQQGEPGRRPTLFEGVAELPSRYSPQEGWGTFAILWGLLLVVAVTLQQADWTDTPGMIFIVLLSSLAGLGLAKVKLPWPLLILAGLALGFLIVYWQTSRLVADESFIGQLRQTAVRLDEWYEAATSGGISTDLMPFTIALLGGTWLLGFLSAWFLFRRANVWPAILLAGLALFTHISFLPSERVAAFFVFVALVMLLIVRMGSVKSQRKWKESGTRFTSGSGWITVGAALALSALVLAVSASLPLNVYVSRSVATIWTQVRTPVASLEGGFARLVTGIASKKNIHGRPFGDNLPFLGAINFNGDVVFTADTEYPSYWLSRTYSEYTSQGWIAGETRALDVGPDTVLPAPGDSLKRTAVPQSVRLNFNSTAMLAGGDLEWLSRNARLDVLAPKSFQIRVADPSGDAEFPDDIKTLARDLRAALNSPVVSFVESEVARMLPDDLVVTKIDYSQPGGRPQVDGLTIQRKEAISPDVVSFEFDQQLLESESYDMVSLVSTASDDDLRRAGTDYGSSITDHYLQLPANLPDRVRELAARLTQTAETPLDKARAIEEYLRGPSFVYSQDIDAPPTEADGVDHFLFESRTGYSDYFASSMAVMLRTVGVPARMAAGYAPGQFDAESGRNAVRDSDSHGWVQVYFPDFGWIDFEPTPAWPDPSRQVGRPAGTVGASGTVAVETPAPTQPEGFQFPAEVGLTGLGLEGGFEGGPESFDYLRLVVVPIIAVIVALLLVIAVLQLLWNLGVRGLAPEVQIYAKMSRLGAVAGLGRTGNQTPSEYAHALGLALPTLSGESSLVATHYSAVRYGAQASPGEQSEALTDAWKAIRRALLGKTLRRLLPGG